MYEHRSTSFGFDSDVDIGWFFFCLFVKYSVNKTVKCRYTLFCSAGDIPQRTYDVNITALSRQNDIAASF